MWADDRFVRPSFTIPFDPAFPMTIPALCRRRLLLTVFLLPLLFPSFVDAQIDRATQVTMHPAQFERLDFVVMLTADWKDPYCSTDVQLDLELTSPSGKPVTLPAYYERGASGRLSEWHARFAPAEAGTYHGRFVLVQGLKRQASAELAFSVAPTGHRGFLHPAGPWLFRFDNGEPFRGIGENIGWESRASDDSHYFKALHENPRFNYEYLLGRLAGHGGNFVRTWMCAWNLPLEWPRVVDTDRYRDDPGRFNASAIARLDQLIELAASTDVYLMLTLDPHGSLLGRLWDLNPYNAKNGGPAATPSEFFTNPSAKARYKDRLRYLVARWGYSPHLGIWEFFNEIDNAMYEQKPERIADDVITAWHKEMGAYLRQLDPAGRPITTSISHRDVTGLNRIPAIDLNQKHIYRNTAEIPATLRRYVAAEGKPYAIGEYGYEWDWSKNFNEFADRMDGDFKHGLWLGLFSPTPILPMTWWWEFFDERNLTPYFAGVREISDRMLAAGQGEFAEVAVAAGPFTALGVRCGSDTFVYAYNPTAGTATTDLHVTTGRPNASTVETYDPETRRGQAAPAGSPGADGLTLSAITLRAGESRLWIIR
jgi:hypothetical protein